MIKPCLLDTDMLSEIMRGKDREVARHADAYLQTHGAFAISDFTRFEIVRGLRWRGAVHKLAAFEQISQAMTIYPVTAEILDRAAWLWADGAVQGKPKMDADVIIAATALVHGRDLVTGNVAHFQWISGLTASSWRD